MKRLITMLCLEMLISALIPLTDSIRGIQGLAYAEERSVTVKAKKGAVVSAPVNTKYYALIIGNNNYKHLPKLKTAVNDAQGVEKMLKNRYGFETKLLIDATRSDILDSVNEMREKVGERDNLLIYYAGHGHFEKTADKGYWLPIDAHKDRTTNWIIADDITSNIKLIASRHILIVSDSCYSGTLTRAVSTELSIKKDREEFIKKMMERSSRTLMASGGNEPVSDSGGGNNSVFAGAFLKALEEFSVKDVFTAEELFHGRVKSSVAGKSDQVPEYNQIKNSGDDGGDFVFRLASLFPLNKGGLGVVEPEIKPSAEISEEMKNLQEEKEKLKSEREELAQQKAIMEEKKRLNEERQKLEKEKLEVASLQPPPPQITPPLKKGDEGGFNMVLIPSGEFMAGEPGSLKGMVLSAFYIDKYEVTQRDFQQVMGNNPSRFTGCDNCPVERVTWNEANEYCGKVGKRLPTEWEWEKAAKAGTTTTYYWGESESMADSYAWYGNNSGSKTHPVGQKKPNNYGLYDMAGNVWEWTSTDYNSSNKVLRGGSWGSGPVLLRSSDRDRVEPTYRDGILGFRCAGASGH
ncbi:MAG: SUMF1/EgtB/PvdO family nonheme iron enzyme [Nitrospinae bacterium]|nr:SUMF1/EgtB/PvdO family nonheme iron enzyme [Nitrospinota bacterium]